MVGCINEAAPCPFCDPLSDPCMQIGVGDGPFTRYAGGIHHRVFGCSSRGSASFAALLLIHCNRTSVSSACCLSRSNMIIVDAFAYLPLRILPASRHRIKFRFNPLHQSYEGQFKYVGCTSWMMGYRKGISIIFRFVSHPAGPVLVETAIQFDQN